MYNMYKWIQINIEPLLGPRPLRRVTDIVSGPRTWNHNAGVISFEAQPTNQIMGTGKDHSTTCFRPIRYWHYLYALTFSLLGFAT